MVYTIRREVVGGTTISLGQRFFLMDFQVEVKKAGDVIELFRYPLGDKGETKATAQYESCLEKYKSA